MKEIRSVRKWAHETFGDERAIQFTVGHPREFGCQRQYIRMADSLWSTKSGTNNNNYANNSLIVGVPKPPMFTPYGLVGHASSPLCPKLAASQKILFIGPHLAMRSLGDKSPPPLSLLTLRFLVYHGRYCVDDTLWWARPIWCQLLLKSYKKRLLQSAWLGFGRKPKKLDSPS